MRVSNHSDSRCGSRRYRRPTAATAAADKPTQGTQERTRIAASTRYLFRDGEQTCCCTYARRNTVAVLVKLSMLGVSIQG